MSIKIRSVCKQKDSGNTGKFACNIISVADFTLQALWIFFNMKGMKVHFGADAT